MLARLGEDSPGRRSLRRSPHTGLVAESRDESAALASLPQGLAGLTAGLLGARLADRFGTKALLLATIATSAAGHILLLGVIGSGDYVLVTAAVFAVGFGNGGAAFAATVAGCDCVADREQGLAAGLINASRQIGSALGVAALMDVATSVTPYHHVPGGAALATGYRAALVFAAGLATAAFFVSVAFVPADHAIRLPNLGDRRHRLGGAAARDRR